jgi:hypothetical protein
MGNAVAQSTDRGCYQDPAVSVATRIFTFPNTAGSTDLERTVPIQTVRRLDQLVIVPSAGGLPTAPAVVLLPSHIGLLGLFKRPAEYDTQSWLVTNATTQAIDLTLADPHEAVTLPAASLSRVYYRIVDPTYVVGQAQLELIRVPIP